MKWIQETSPSILPKFYYLQKQLFTKLQLSLKEGASAGLPRYFFLLFVIMSDFPPLIFLPIPLMLYIPWYVPQITHSLPYCPQMYCPISQQPIFSSSGRNWGRRGTAAPGRGKREAKPCISIPGLQDLPIRFWTTWGEKIQGRRKRKKYGR